MKKRTLLWIGLSFNLVALVYCALWAIRSAWLSATPNYPLEKAQFYFTISGMLTILFLVISIAISILLNKDKNKDKEHIENK